MKCNRNVQRCEQIESERGLYQNGLRLRWAETETVMAN